MRKSWIITAGALGLIAVAVESRAEIALNFAHIKIDSSHTVEACTGQGGSVGTDHGQSLCLLPNQGGAPGVWKAPAGSAAPASLKIKLNEILISSVKTDGAATTPR